MNAQVPIVRVLIADNNPDFLSALAQYVRSIPGVELVGEAVDGEDAIKKAEATYPVSTTVAVQQLATQFTMIINC